MLQNEMLLLITNRFYLNLRYDLRRYGHLLHFLRTSSRTVRLLLRLRLPRPADSARALRRVVTRLRQLPDALRLATDDAATQLAAALALLTLGRIEQREIVVVRQLFAALDVALREQRHAELTVDRPFLHFAIRRAGMVDEPPVAAHAVAVDDETAVEVEAIVVRVVGVDGTHAFFEFLIGDDLADVFQNEVAAFDRQFRSNAPT